MKKLLLTCMMMLIGLSSYAQTTVTIGAGNATSGTNDNGNPIYRSTGSSSFHHSKSVQLLTASDLAAATVPSGATISSIAYNKATAFNVSGTNKWTLNVYLKNSSATALASGTAWNTMIGGATLFYTETIDSTNNFPAAAGWITWNNTTGNMFNYSGGSIEVFIEWVPGGTMVSPFTDGAFLWAYDGVTTGAQAIGTSSSTPILGTQTSFTVQPRRYQTQLSYTATACTGTPAPGNTLSSGTPVCPGDYNTTLSVQNPTTGLGITYQWYRNSVAIPGANSAIYTTPINAADTYYCEVTCSSNVGSSTPLTVTAPLSTVVPYYINDFSTFPGTCWSQASGGDPATGPTGTNTLWFSNAFLNAGPSGGATRINIYGIDRIGWLKTVAFDLSAGGYRVKFDYGLTEYFSSNPATIGLDDNIQFIVSTDGGATWTMLQTWDKSTPVSNTLNTFTYDLSAYTGTSNIFAFYATSGATATGDYDFHLDNFVVETIPLCDTPLNLTTSNLTATSVDVAWVAPTSPPAGGYDIYYSTSNTAPTAATVPTTTSTTTSVSLTGIAPIATTYIWVRSNCGATKSAWVATSVYTGACQPTGGTSSSDYYLSSIVTTGGSSNLAYTATSFVGYDDQSATTFSGSPGTTVTADLATTGGTDYRYYAWIDWNNDLDFTDAGEEVYASAGYVITASAPIAIPSTQVAGNYRVRFATDYISALTPCGPAGYGNYVDFTLVVGAPPTCVSPTALSTTGVTTTTGDISWTAPATAPANGYEVYYSTSTTPPSAGTPATVTGIAGTNTTLSGLSTATTYYVWVRSNCSASDKSSWSNRTTVVTTCVATNVPYTLDFSSATVPGLPLCTSVVNDGAGNLWKTNSSVTGFTDNVLNYSYNSANPANTWFFTQGVNMVAGTTYYIGYKYGNNDGTTYDEKMKVAIGTSPVSSAMTTQIANYPSILAATPIVVANQTFTPAVSGVYYLGFQAYSDADQNQLYVDDISITDTALSTSETSVRENLLTVYPNPFTDVIRISDLKDVVSISIVDLSGRLVKTLKPAREINLGDLKTGMYLINLKMKDGSVQTVKAIKK